MPDLTKLDAHADEDEVHVVVETPRGSRNKLKYEPELGLFTLHKVLPAGFVFPYDFGFIPSTLADDGDPLDVLLLVEEPVPPGCVVKARLVGVIEAEQKKDGEDPVRNDRLLAVASAGAAYAAVRCLRDLPHQLLDGIEHFFISYNAAAGKEFKPLGRHGPGIAQELLVKAELRNDKSRNGRRKKAGKS